VSTKLSVLLAAEGTYPFHKGGVSTWCDALTWKLPEIDFTLLAVMMHPYLAQQYPLAPNVSLLPVPLWGTEHPAEFDPTSRFAEYMRRRWRCDGPAIGRDFLEPFDRFLRLAIGKGLDGSSDDRQALADTLVELHEFFLGHDIRRALFSRVVWEHFDGLTRQLHTLETGAGDTVSAADVAQALQLLYRLILVLTVRVPETDVTHSAAAAFCGLPCVIARLTRGTPYLLTEHGIYVREQYLNLRRTIKSPFVRWFMYRLIGAVTAVNYHVADQISPVCAFNARWETWAGVPVDKIRVIYNGVDPRRFQPGPEPSDDPPTVVNVGLIYPLKGQLELIEAAALVRKRMPRLRVLLYGSVNDEEYFAQCQRRVESLYLQGTVTFAGPTSTPWTAYQEATVVAMSSISEAFPYAVIEAMLCAAPVVATDTGGVSEALGDAGIIVAPRDRREMANALFGLLRDPDARRALGTRARCRALEHFTQDQFLLEHRETYGRLRAMSLPERDEKSTSTHPLSVFRVNRDRSLTTPPTYMPPPDSDAPHDRDGSTLRRAE
jgi:polysaccharide biosynthesis protein PelF